MVGGALAFLVIRALSVPLVKEEAAREAAGAGPVDETGAQLPEEGDRDARLPRARAAADADLPQRERRPQ
jgi:hypothetical protein